MVRLLGAVAVLLFVLGTGLAFAASDDEPAEASAAALSAQPVSDAAIEIPAQRTATSKTYVLPNGARETRIYESPVNYRSAAGDWMPIEGRGEVSSDGNDVSANNPPPLHFPDRVGSEPMRVTIGDQWVSSKLLGSTTQAPKVAGDTSTYETSDGGTAFELTRTPIGVKEAIVLDDPSQPSRFKYELSASSGLTPLQVEGGAIIFVDADHHIAARVPAPTISERGSRTELDPNPVSGKLEDLPNDNWALTIEVDGKWLTAADRKWPVTIDPSIEAPKAIPSLDCQYFLKEPPGETNSTPTCGSSGAATLKSEYSKIAGVTASYQSALQFNMSAIPSNASIASASFNLYSPQSISTNVTAVHVKRLTGTWDSSINWKYRLGANAWTIPGGDVSSVDGTHIEPSVRGTGPGWWQFTRAPYATQPTASIQAIVQQWVEGKNANQGLRVSLYPSTPGATTRGPFVFNSSSSSPVANRPYLAATYFLPAPKTSGISSPTEGTVTARRLKLQSRWSAAGVTGITFQFREGKSGSFQDIPAELVRDAKGQPVASWPIALSGVKETEDLYFDALNATKELRRVGGIVQVRAVYEGPKEVAGYSAPVEASVNMRVGGPHDATTQIGPGSVDLLTGNLTLNRTDVSIPGFNSSLEFSRTFNSRKPEAAGTKGVLGMNWTPGVPVEQAGGSQWRNARVVDSSETIEGESYSFAYAVLTGLEGAELAFEKVGEAYVAPPEATGWTLSPEASGTRLVLADPAGSRTTFDNGGSGSEYLPVSISQTGGSGNSTRMVYQFVSGKRRLSMIIAPTPPVISCATEAEAMANAGCHALAFSYAAEKLSTISYYAPGNGGPWEVAKYAYDGSGRLIEQWDPRISPALKEKYTYGGDGQVYTMTPPGQEPWTFEYTFTNEEAGGYGKLLSVKRPSLIPGEPTSQTSVVYGVPVSGSGAPYEMGGSTVAEWGQADIPVDAAAVFPPDQVPARPPVSYSRASVYYMDAEGRLVNAATPSGAGTSAPSITTTESDRFGNAVRELSAQNRLRALAAGSESVARSHELATKRQFSSDGTQMEEEWGPLHQVRLESGSTVQARLHKTVQYAKPPEGITPDPHLPSRETTGASIPGQPIDADQRVTEYAYNWKLRKPTETIVDPKSEQNPNGLNIATVTVYDETTGLPLEQRQPSNPAGGGAGTTKTIYWSGDPQAPCYKASYAGLPCLIEPAAQPGTSGQPQVKVTKIAAYNALAQPTEVWEAPGKAALEAGTPRRTTTLAYDAAGRTQTAQKTGGGATVPKVKIEYSSSTGAPTAQRFDCATGGCEGSDDQAVTSVYDALGRVTEYTDADASTSKVTYDLLGRPVTTNDGKGTQTRTYDPTSGLLTKLEDSAAGTFTASYDADGNLLAEGLPNGLVAESTYDETGARTDLAYNKTACSENCIWLDFDAERSIEGQILAQKSLSSHQEYIYDKAGRLVQTNDWNAPESGICTTRKYVFGEAGSEELAGKNSNRTKLVTRSSGLPGACATSGGSEQKYKYDTADRLINEGVAYDDFGRITSLPSSLAGGKALSSSYFSTDMVASQAQNGITNTFQLDAALRQRQRTQGGGLEGVEVFHYADSSDTPAWTQLGAKWSRNIGGIGGGVSAIQDSSSGTLLQLANLHGDVVATATLSPSATKLVSTFEYDEFGVPKQGGTQQFGWLGSKGRKTEFATGVIQMGVRSYVPSLGRFLTPDPVFGGSANAYDYANQDPVNNFDLAGEECESPNSGWVKRCKKINARIDRRKSALRSAVGELRALIRQKRAAAARGRVTLPGGTSVTFPWEKDATGVIDKAKDILHGANENTCIKAAVGAQGGALYANDKATKVLATGAEAVAARIGAIASRMSWLGWALTGASAFGVC